MRRKRHMAQIEEQNKTPAKGLNKIQTSNLLDAEFKTLVIRMFNECRGRVYELSENFNNSIGNKNRYRKQKRTSWK